MSPARASISSQSDLQFILDQILISEQHAAGAEPDDLSPNPRLPFGLRTVDGSFNNLVPDQDGFGATDNIFPRLLDPFFRNDLDGDTFDANGPAPGAWSPTPTMAQAATLPMPIRASSRT